MSISPDNEPQEKGPIMNDVKAKGAVFIAALFSGGIIMQLGNTFIETATKPIHELTGYGFEIVGGTIVAGGVGMAVSALADFWKIRRNSKK